MKGIEYAKELLGKHEVNDRKELIAFFTEYAKRKDIIIDPKTTPWCAAFINACERAAGFPGTGQLNARSFLKYGKEIALQDAREGDILIFKRGNSSWQGHVTYFYRNLGSGVIQTLGGNQSDAVTYGKGHKDLLLGVRRYE